jgi:hypothetical protein
MLNVIMLSVIMMNVAAPIFRRFCPTGAIGDDWTRTLNLSVTRRVFYHCALKKLFLMQWNWSYNGPKIINRNLEKNFGGKK